MYNTVIKHFWRDSIKHCIRFSSNFDWWWWFCEHWNHHIIFKCNIILIKNIHLSFIFTITTKYLNSYYSYSFEQFIKVLWYYLTLKWTRKNFSNIQGRNIYTNWTVVKCKDVNTTGKLYYDPYSFAKYIIIFHLT